MTREELITEAWKRDAPRVYISEDEYRESFDGWDVVYHPNDEDPAFVAFVKGPEFHFMSLEKRSPLSLRVIRIFLDALIGAYGYALTRTLEDDARQRRFNESIGFKQVGRDEFYIHYVIEKVQRCRS